MTISPATRVKALTQFHLSRVSDQAKALRSQTFPAGQDGSDLITLLIKGYLESASEHIKKLNSPESDTKDFEGHLNTAGEYVHEAYRYLSLLQGASATEIYHPVVAPIIRWLDSLDLKRSILFQAENAANYEVKFFSSWFSEETKLYREPSETLTEAIEKITTKELTVFTVPSSAFAILPHFAIVAHEVGHVLFRKFRDELITREVVISFSKIINKTNSFLEEKKVRLTDQTSVYLRETLTNWLEEYAADAVAGRLAGPAAFFAMSDVFQYMGAGNLPSHTHPIPIDRLEALYDSLTQGEFDFKKAIESQAGKKFTPCFNSVRLKERYDFDHQVVLNEGRGYDAEKSKILACLAEKAGKLPNSIYKAVNNYLKQNHNKHIYHSENLEDDIEQYLENLLKAIPPIESGTPLVDEKPADFVSILNIGWIVLLCRMEDFDVKVSGSPDHLRDGAKSEILHDLLLKAVELSEARLKWQKTSKMLP